MALPESYISIQDKIDEFNSYLSLNDRCILSARFGDGKSTFLEEFKDQNSEYELITIYPLHYQISDNKDILEYIKRDILMQILSFAELDNDTFNETIILAQYLKKERLSIMEDIVDSIPKIDIGVCSTDMIKTPLKNLLKNTKKYKEFKNEINKTKESKTEAYITAFDNYKGSIYEFDLISELICKIIVEIKDKTGKNIVLVVEDLDRVDPAHIFRILNIFSAHIERNHSGVNEWENNGLRNKFKFDKILFVCDYDNIESIFHHLYGEKTDFKGYISKFTSAIPFRYSLKERINKFITESIDRELVEYPIIIDCLSDYLQRNHDYNLRNISNIIRAGYNVRQELLELSSPANESDSISFQTSSLNAYTKFLDILNRLNIDYKKFIIASEGVTNFSYELYKMIGTSWFIKGINVLYIDSSYNIYISPKNNSMKHYLNHIGNERLLSLEYSDDTKRILKAINNKNNIIHQILNTQPIEGHYRVKDHMTQYINNKI